MSGKGILTALAIACCAVAQAQEDRFRIDPQSDFEGPAHAWIRTQLQPTLEMLEAAFGRDPGFPIEVHRRRDNPEVNLVAGVQRVGLTATEYYWMQYNYQFAHELGHVFTNWQMANNYSYKWFEETLAELASLYVIASYARKSPYDFYTGQQWAEYLASIRQKQEQDRFRQFGLAANDLAAGWFRHLRPQMEKNSTIRSLNGGIAFELLPHFLEHPALWEACGHLNRWDTSEDDNFRDYLSSWTMTLIMQGQDIQTAQLVSRLLYRR